MSSSKRLVIQGDTLTLYRHRWAYILSITAILVVSVVAVGFSWYMHQNETGMSQLFFKIFGGFFAFVAVMLLLALPKYLKLALSNDSNAFVSFRADDAGMAFSGNDPARLDAYPWDGIDALVFAEKTIANSSDGKWIQKHALVVFLKTKTLNLPEGFFKKTSFLQTRGMSQTKDKRYYLHQTLSKDSVAAVRRHLENMPQTQKHQIGISTVETLDLN